jgi:hypothetical protein
MKLIIARKKKEGGWGRTGAREASHHFVCVRTTVDVINFFNYEKWIFDLQMTMSFLFRGGFGWGGPRELINSAHSNSLLRKNESE